MENIAPKYGSLLQLRQDKWAEKSKVKNWLHQKHGKLTSELSAIVVWCLLKLLYMFRIFKIEWPKTEKKQNYGQRTVGRVLPQHGQTHLVKAKLETCWYTCRRRLSPDGGASDHRLEIGSNASRSGQVALLAMQNRTFIGAQRQWRLKWFHLFGTARAVSRSK